MIRPFLLALGSAALLATGAAAASPKPEDFAFGKVLILAGGEAIYEVDLPEEIYQRTARGGVEDVAIFNGGGELVPFRLSPPSTAAATPEKRALPFFPIPPAEAGGDSLSVLVRRGRAGEVLSLRQTRPAVRAAPAYLLDLTGIDRPVKALEFDWNDGAAGVVGKVRVEGSDNLTDWQAVVEGETVAKVHYGPHLLERRAVDLGQRRSRYLRLTFAGVPETFRLEEVRAVFTPARVEPPRRRLAVPSRQLKPNEFAFSLPGAFPVDRLRVKPPQPNTLVQATFFSRQHEDDPWSQRTAALVYTLNVNGSLLTSPEIAVGASGHRYWLMRVGAEGGGVGEGLPEIEAGWIPHRVRFVARGNPPFLLAYGSGRHDLSRLPADAPLLRLTSERKELPVGSAELGAETVLGGEQALRRHLSPHDWKAVLLWSALVGSVFFLAWMALSLYRRLDRKEGEAGPE